MFPRGMRGAMGSTATAPNHSILPSPRPQSPRSTGGPAAIRTSVAPVSRTAGAGLGQRTAEGHLLMSGGRLTLINDDPRFAEGIQARLEPILGRPARLASYASCWEDSGPDIE